MKFTFRAKLMAIVGTAALAFVVLIAASALIAKRVEQQLNDIQQRYVPRVDLGPRLDGQLERIRRGFQDAVAAHDAEALAATREFKNKFLEQLASARNAVDSAQAAALRSAFERYDVAAYDVSRRLISGETGEALVGAMTVMQVKNARRLNFSKRLHPLTKASSPKPSRR